MALNVYLKDIYRLRSSYNAFKPYYLLPPGFYLLPATT